MVNKFNSKNGKTIERPGTPNLITGYATAGVLPTITFQCKDIRSINDVKITCDAGYACVPTARARNVVSFRIYKTSIHYNAPGGGGSAVTAAAAAPNALERAAGASATDTTTLSPVEIPDGAPGTYAINVYGLALGTI